MDLEKSKADAEGLYASVQIVSDYMKDRWNNLIDPVFPDPKTGFRDACIKALFCRAMAWMQTLEKMNKAVCFQGVIAGNRVLLEILVDLFLLHKEKTYQIGWKYYWWSQSEKLEASEKTIKYYDELNLPLPDAYEIRRDFVEREKHNIEQIRKAFWVNKKGKAYHPKRWTGNTLFADIKIVDQLYGAEIKKDLGKTLAELYMTEYSFMCWQAHSGISYVWNASHESFNLSTALAFKACADISMLCSKIVLKDFGFTDHLPTLRQEWDELEIQRAIAFYEIREKSSQELIDNGKPEIQTN